MAKPNYCPDLPPLVISADWKAKVQNDMPELPAARRERYENDFALPAYHAAQLTLNRPTSDYFEQVVEAAGKEQAKMAANWVMGEVMANLNRDELEITQSPVNPAQLAKLFTRINDNTISNKIARDVFQAMWAGENGADVDAIIEAKGLKQISDTGAISKMIDDVLVANPAIVDEYRSGKEKAFNSLVGQVMKAAKGKANPAQVNELLKQKLS